MGPIDSGLSAQFRRWEARTRGWQVYPEPVEPEPAFEPFHGHALPPAGTIDDGRRPTIVSQFLSGFFAPAASAPEPEEPSDPLPAELEREAMVELPLLLPAKFEPHGDAVAGLLSGMGLCSEPLAFELIGTADRVLAQFVAAEADAPRVREQIQAYFPEVVCVPASETLAEAWYESGNCYAAVDFGLAREGMRLLAVPPHDLHVALVGALGALLPGEMGVFQVLFQPATHPWPESLIRSVTDAAGRPFFVNAPELADAARAKAARPLFGVVLRVLACAATEDRVWEILRSLAAPLGALGQASGNELIPLHNDDYPLVLHTDDVLGRQSRRGGLLLNADELRALVHLPSSDVRHSKFERLRHRTKRAPDFLIENDGIALGENVHAGVSRTVRLTHDMRTRHVHVIGASGTGKTTLLFQMIRQDIEAGHGVGVLDPHGDLIDQILGVIPENRIGDVVLLNPSDEEYVVGFNPLHAQADWEKTQLASDLVAVFRRLSTSWGDQMGSVLQNAILAFLESTRGGTLVDLRRFLLDAKFREEFLGTVRDPEIVFYWKHAFAQLSGNKSLGPVLTRLETFLAPKPVRYLVAQTKKQIDFRSLMDTGKIFLARLSRGDLGKENAHLLGSLIVAKIHQVTMTRQRQEAASRRPFWLYIDECQDFMTPSMAEILTSVRKYELGLTLAHHELRQLQNEPEVASAVLSNSYTRVCFRVGDHDARTLAEGFGYFDDSDLQNLGTGMALGRVERKEFDFNLAIPPAIHPGPREAKQRRAAVVQRSHTTYGTPRNEIEILAIPPEEPPQARPSPSAPTPVSPPPPVKVAPPPADTPPPAAEPTVVPAMRLPISKPPLPLPEPPAPKQTLPDPAPSPLSEERPPSRPSDPGRGGVQHKAIQKRIQTAAHDLGFRATVEKELPAGGSVDLAIEGEDFSVACEITITTTIDHEVGNVEKCLDAGFKRIVLIGVELEKLERIAAAVRTSLGIAAASKVACYLPDAFIAELRTRARSSPKAPETRTIRGRKVKTTHTPVTPHEARAREHALLETVRTTMQRPR